MGAKVIPSYVKVDFLNAFKGVVQHERLYLRVRASAPVIATQKGVADGDGAGAIVVIVAGGPDHQPLPVLNEQRPFDAIAASKNASNGPGCQRSFAG